jgi:hypothetical protein
LRHSQIGYSEVIWNNHVSNGTVSSISCFAAVPIFGARAGSG